MKRLIVVPATIVAILTFAVTINPVHGGGLPSPGYGDDAYWTVQDMADCIDLNHIEPYNTRQHRDGPRLGGWARASCDYLWYQMNLDGRGYMGLRVSGKYDHAAIAITQDHSFYGLAISGEHPGGALMIAGGQDIRIHGAHDIRIRYNAETGNIEFSKGGRVVHTLNMNVRE